MTRAPATVRSHAKPWFRDRTVEQLTFASKVLARAIPLMWAKLPEGLVSAKEAQRYGVVKIS